MEGSLMALYNQIIIHEVKKKFQQVLEITLVGLGKVEMKYGRKIGQVQKQ